MSKPVSTELVVTSLEGFKAEPSAEASTKKSELLQISSLVLTVSNEEESCDAIDAASQLKALEASVEKTRKIVKAPVLKAGEAIDTAAKEFCNEVTKERLRIEKLLTDYQIKLRNESRAREDEQRRLQEEANAKERERLRLEHEQTTREAEALGEAIPEPAPFVPPVVSVVVQEAPKMDGARLKTEYDFEVTDIHALYAWNRLFVKLEVDRGNFKAYLNMPGIKIDTIPGVRVFESNKTITKAASTKEVRVIE